MGSFRPLELQWCVGSTGFTAGPFPKTRPFVSKLPHLPMAGSWSALEASSNSLMLAADKHRIGPSVRWRKPRDIRLRAVGTGSAVLNSNMIGNDLFNVFTSANYAGRRTAQLDQVLSDWTTVEQLLEEATSSPVRLRKSPPPCA
jgi:hypothetical protein